MNAAFRAHASRCMACGFRCEAWICSSCCFDSETVRGRFYDDRKPTTATAVSRAQQRRLAARVEHDHVRFYRSIDAYRQGFFFNREELIHWTAKLAEIDPAYRAKVATAQRARDIAKRATRAALARAV